MATSPRTWRDTVWLVWFCIQIPVILCVDIVDKYPAWLCANPGAPLHALHRFRQWYIATHNDPVVQWTPATHPLLSNGGGSWVPLFFWIELVFTLPTVLYAVYRLGFVRGRNRAPLGGTTGPLELLLLVYALETALTTAVCIHNISYWDPSIYSSAQKNTFRFQLMGPWLAMPSLLFLDMYSRLLARFSLAVNTDKKTR
ncbi:hypothetical protein CMQ_3849 [Grosmannia clavigera kw1407]|uniref:EXPERA domain-containing protein n=1 Tax=Grosmannia clavigera (strain kw1407 / UAMH 11150) TaxID=655863 RepID=F0X824_GROCL|nr:uncharacterized protein CMQ_3849 [Grosmannia clavigera kw1407]EFX05780.1 hypothetical protein CMQ_3849 [Grosmannia clavigera kw1407]